MHMKNKFRMDRREGRWGDCRRCQVVDTDAGSESSESEEDVVVGGSVKEEGGPISARIQIRREESNMITHLMYESDGAHVLIGTQGLQ